MDKFSIYTLKGIDKKKAVYINYLDTFDISLKDEIKDTVLSKFEISKGIGGEVFACNIKDSLLMSSKKLPFLYIRVSYTKNSFIQFPLYMFFIHFNIESDIETADDLIGKPVYGRFSSEIMFDDRIELLDNDIGDFIGGEEFISSLIELTKTDLMIETSREIIAKVEKDVAKEHKQDFNFKIPENRISLKDYKL